MRRLVLIALLVAPTALAQSVTVFKGRPALQAFEQAVTRSANALAGDKAEQYDCVISKIGDDYYWASRENRLLVRMESGAYITYVAANGAGYIKIVKPELREAAMLVDPAAEKYDYVEHIVLGLTSISYYGKRR